MIDKNIKVGRIALTTAEHSDKSFGYVGFIRAFDGLNVEIEVGGSIIRRTVTGIALVCDTSDEVSKLQRCDDQTYAKIVALKQARTIFIKNSQV